MSTALGNVVDEAQWELREIEARNYTRRGDLDRARFLREFIYAMED